jgi:hypothetical protein
MPVPPTRCPSLTRSPGANLNVRSQSRDLQGFAVDPGRDCRISGRRPSHFRLEVPAGLAWVVPLFKTLAFRRSSRPVLLVGARPGRGHPGRSLSGLRPRFVRGRGRDPRHGPVTVPDLPGGGDAPPPPSPICRPPGTGTSPAPGPGSSSESDGGSAPGPRAGRRKPIYYSSGRAHASGNDADAPELL